MLKTVVHFVTPGRTGLAIVLIKIRVEQDVYFCIVVSSVIIYWNPFIKLRVVIDQKATISIATTVET